MASQSTALLGDENCVELCDRSRLCYNSIIVYNLDITNILVVSPEIRYIEVFDIMNPQFNEQIWPVPIEVPLYIYTVEHLYIYMQMYLKIKLVIGSSCP